METVRLKPRIAAGPEAPALRQLLVRHTRNSSNLTQVMSDEILQASMEEQTESRVSETVAAGVLRPAFA